jgi:hypothetical protein
MAGLCELLLDNVIAGTRLELRDCICWLITDGGGAVVILVMIVID